MLTGIPALFAFAQQLLGSSLVPNALGFSEISRASEGMAV
jgi:hypothetical protein